MNIQFLFTLRPVLADIAGGLFLFVILAVAVTILRLLFTAMSKVKKPVLRDPAFEPQTLTDGGYNWTGKQPAAAITPSPAPEVLESEAAESEIGGIFSGETETAGAHCTNCGAETGAGWKFCRECGQALG